MNHSGLSPRHLLGEPARCGVEFRPAHRAADTMESDWQPPPCTPERAHADAVAHYAAARAHLGRVNARCGSRAERADAMRFVNHARRLLHRAADAAAAARADALAWRTAA